MLCVLTYLPVFKLSVSSAMSKNIKKSDLPTQLFHKPLKTNQCTSRGDTPNWINIFILILLVTPCILYGSPCIMTPIVLFLKSSEYMLSEYILLLGSNVNFWSYSTKPVKACDLFEKYTCYATGAQHKKHDHKPNFFFMLHKTF